MRVLSLLALLPSAVYTAGVQPNANAISPQINGSSVLDQLINATGLGFVDPRFTINPEEGLDAIDSVSAYMNVLGILTSLALEDFNGQLTGTEEACITPWTDVYVSVERLGPEPLERRFAIWGLLMSIYHMSFLGFTDSNIDLEYDGLPVGAVYFRLTRPDTLEAAGDNTNSTITDPEAAASEKTNSSVTGLEAMPTIQTTYKPNGRDLTTAAVYISLAGALVQMAQKDQSDPMFYLTNVWVEFTTRIKVTPERRAAHVGQGIVAVWLTALYIAQRQPPRYAEYTSLIIAEGVLIGRIDVDYVEGPPPAVQKPGSSAAGQGVVATT